MGPWAFGVPIILVSSIGLLCNSYILLVVLGLGKQIQQQQTANLLLLHLGAVEAAVCVILIFSSWPIAGTWCVLHGFLLALLHPVALWTVTGLNCERYYAIASPLHYADLVSPRRVILGLAASWTGSLLLCLPPISGLVPPYTYIPGLGCCAPDFGSAAVYGVAYASIGLALPAVVVTICNFRVLGIARYHRHRIASAIYAVTLSAQVTITHQRNPFFIPTVTSPAAGGGPPRFHSAASTVMQLVGSLYLLYFPYCGFVLWCCASGGAGTQQRLHAHFASLASLLLACSPTINGLLYGLKSRTFRRSVQNYWRKKATKSELQQEIQARTPSATGSRRTSGNGQASFPPPLQRRLSEALFFGSCRGNTFGESNVRNPFRRTKLQTASCNTLRVPSAEIGGTMQPMRSASTVSLQVGSRFCNDFGGSDAGAGNDGGCPLAMSETSGQSPRILITRAYSEESQDGESPLLARPFSTSAPAPISKVSEKRRWRQCSTGSDSSAGSDVSVWTTGVAQKVTAWPASRRFIKTVTTTTSTTLSLKEDVLSARDKSDSSWSSSEEVFDKETKLLDLEDTDIIESDKGIKNGKRLQKKRSKREKTQARRKR